jgi:2-polyprenyl-6-methoxyphenol hydroxylase-like FAD-dependent oxidoreductase
MSGLIETTQVAIVGGGPVGLGLAIELGQRGVACTIIERNEQPLPIPRGQNLTQRTMEHMHFWSCERALRAARTIPPEYGIGGMTAYGTLLGDYTYDWMQRELVRPFYFTDNERLPQYATEAVLRARVARLPNVTLHTGFRVDDVTRDADGVTITATHRDGATKTLRAAYGVGCDGARSIVRARAGITQTLSDHDRLMVLLVFRSPALHERLKRYPGKSFYAVITPEMQGYWKFFGRVDLDGNFFFHAPVPAGTTAENYDFRPLVHGAVGEAFEMEFRHIGFWDLRFAVADSYRAGRLFIAGDAAHSHPPYGGYGINTGFEDARNLGWKLAAALQGWGTDALLESYSAERQPVFASTAGDFIEKSIHVDRDFLAEYDPAKDRAAFEAKWNERRTGAVAEVGAFEPNYEGSPVVFGPEGGRTSAVGRHMFSARAGHHFAPAGLSSGENTFAALGPWFTLFAFGAAEATVAAFVAAAERLGVELAVVRDDRGEERARYEAGLVLVRPDQFVAWAGEDGADADEVMRRAIGA